MRVLLDEHLNWRLVREFSGPTRSGPSEGWGGPGRKTACS